MSIETMSTEAIEALAAEYVLGTLDEAQRSDFEHQLAVNQALRHSVERWQDRLGLLVEKGPEIEPSARLWTAIEAATEAQPGPGLMTIRKTTDSWKTIGQGVQMKTLYINRNEGYRSFLIHLEPGAKLPSHGHTLTEECLVLEGEMILGRQRFYAGDFHVAEAGSHHPEIHTDTGGMLFIRGPIDEMTPGAHI